MELTVTVEQVENNGFQARSGEPIPVVAAGSTREEALDRLRSALAERVASGLEVVRLNLPTVTPQRPLWPDDQITRDWIDGIEEARRRGDALKYPWEEDVPEGP